MYNILSKVHTKYLQGVPNEVSTLHDMNYDGQVWYPTLVDKLINFTKIEPLFQRYIRKDRWTKLSYYVNLIRAC
jgi:hypothetical protein